MHERWEMTMNRIRWDVLDEAEQESELHDARRIGFLLAAGDTTPEDYSPAELAHALTVLICEYERVVELEAETGGAVL